MRPGVAGRGLTEKGSKAALLAGSIQIEVSFVADGTWSAHSGCGLTKEGASAMGARAGNVGRDQPATGRSKNDRPHKLS